MYINFVNETAEDVSKYEKLIRGIFKQFKKKKEIFSIVFVDKEEIQRINREYRNIDRVTDVISFALNDNDEGNEFDDGEIGDMFICLDRAREQAADYGHSVDREVGFLAVHGYLHLSGYDHMTPEDEKVMFRKQDEILEKAGLTRHE